MKLLTIQYNVIAVGAIKPNIIIIAGNTYWTIDIRGFVFRVGPVFNTKYCIPPAIIAKMILDAAKGTLKRPNTASGTPLRIYKKVAMPSFLDYFQ